MAQDTHDTRDTVQESADTNTAQKNLNLYLDPYTLTPNAANEKARPAESAEQRAARVAEMAASIAANGQEYPVLVVEIQEDDGVRYEYVDGGGRVEAIAKLNEDGGDRLVWCSLVDPDADLYRKALVGNIHRTQNSLMDTILIVQEVFDQNDWRGKGGANKVAEYLGLSKSRVSEYQKIYQRAPQELREMMRDGRVNKVEVALQMLAVPEEKAQEVAVRAGQLAEEEVVSGTPTTADPAPGKQARVRVKHVQQAAAEAGAEIERGKQPKTKKEIVEAFYGYAEEGVYAEKLVEFAKYFGDKWVMGQGTDETLWKKFEAAIEAGVVRETKPAAKTEPKKVQKPEGEKAPVVQSKPEIVKTAKPAKGGKDGGKKTAAKTVAKTATKTKGKK